MSDVYFLNVSLRASGDYRVTLSYNLSNAVVFNFSVSIPFSSAVVGVRLLGETLVDFQSGSGSERTGRQTVNVVVGFNVSEHPNVLGRLAAVYASQGEYERAWKLVAVKNYQDVELFVALKGRQTAQMAVSGIALASAAAALLVSLRIRKTMRQKQKNTKYELMEMEGS